MTHRHHTASAPASGSSSPRLPLVTTRDLNGDRQTLPNGRLSVLVLAYERWQQREVDTWIPALDDIERQFTGTAYYELPVVGAMSAFGRSRLDFWMRRGIPDPSVRARTLTFYVDPARLRAPLGIPDEDHIAVVLVDGDGHVLWKGQGPHAAWAEQALRAAISAATTRVH